jgi:hypothetical protein
MFNRLEILATQSIQDAAPELRVPAYAVVGVWTKLPPLAIDPGFRDPVLQMFPDRFRIPILSFLGNKISTLEDENPRSRRGEGVCDRAAPGAASDDDDVVSFDSQTSY